MLHSACVFVKCIYSFFHLIYFALLLFPLSSSSFKTTSGNFISPDLSDFNFLQLGSTGCLDVGIRVSERKVCRLSFFIFKCEKKIKFFGSTGKVNF